MLAAARWRAKQKDLPFNLTAEFLQRVCEPGTCSYCGTPVVHGSKGHNPLAGALDKIDPALGYTKGNVVLACATCNGRKGDMLPSQLRALADAVEVAIRTRVIRS